MTEQLVGRTEEHFLGQNQAVDFGAYHIPLPQVVKELAKISGASSAENPQFQHVVDTRCGVPHHSGGMPPCSLYVVVVVLRLSRVFLLLPTALPRLTVVIVRSFVLLSVRWLGSLSVFRSCS